MKQMILLFWLHSNDISADDARAEDSLTAEPDEIRAEVTICGVVIGGEPFGSGRRRTSRAIRSSRGAASLVLAFA